jgi:hypothetical protein
VTVVALRSYKRQPTKQQRNVIYEVYGGCCVYCPRDKGPLDDWHCDHFDPWSKSKDGALTNFVVSCPMHNMQKKDSDDKSWLDLMRSVNPLAWRKFCWWNDVPIIEEVKVTVPIFHTVSPDPTSKFQFYPRLRSPLATEETE